MNRYPLTRRDLAAVAIPPALGEPAGPVKGMIGCWMFNEGKGLEAGDSSGKGHVGKLEKGAAWHRSSSPANPGSIRLDGDGDYIELGRRRPFLQNVTAATLSAWINPVQRDKNRKPIIISIGRVGADPR